MEKKKGVLIVFFSILIVFAGVVYFSNKEPKKVIQEKKPIIKVSLWQQFANLTDGRTAFSSVSRFEDLNKLRHVLGIAHGNPRDDCGTNYSNYSRAGRFLLKLIKDLNKRGIVPIIPHEGAWTPNLIDFSLIAERRDVGNVSEIIPREVFEAAHRGEINLKVWPSDKRGEYFNREFDILAIRVWHFTNKEREPIIKFSIENKRYQFGKELGRGGDFEYTVNTAGLIEKNELDSFFYCLGASIIMMNSDRGLFEGVVAERINNPKLKKETFIFVGGAHHGIFLLNKIGGTDSATYNIILEKEIEKCQGYYPDMHKIMVAYKQRMRMIDIWEKVGKQFPDARYRAQRKLEHNFPKYKKWLP